EAGSQELASVRGLGVTCRRCRPGGDLAYSQKPCWRSRSCCLGPLDCHLFDETITVPSNSLDEAGFFRAVVQSAACLRHYRVQTVRKVNKTSAGQSWCRNSSRVTTSLGCRSRI